LVAIPPIKARNTVTSEPHFLELELENEVKRDNSVAKQARKGNLFGANAAKAGLIVRRSRFGGSGEPLSKSCKLLLEGNKSQADLEGLIDPSQTGGR
jgi:hypothetical protein